MIFEDIGPRYLLETQRKTACYQASDREYRSCEKCKPRYFGEQKETTMRQKTLTVLALLLISAAAQAATATEHRHMRTKERAAVCEPWRNSNAYAAPGEISVPSAQSVQSEGAMTSGLAGH